MGAVLNLREQLKFLEENNQLVHIKKAVSPKFELSAVSKKLETGPAVLFENVVGYSMPVVVGTDNSRERVAKCLGTDNRGLLNIYMNAINNPLPPIKVSDGPVKEVKQIGNVDILGELPVPIHYEKDGGPYISSGLLVAELPEEGIRNVSYQRLQVTGKDEIRLLIQPRHLWQLYQRMEQDGKPLEVAIVIGMDTACRLAGATWGSKVGLGVDEFAIAGALRGKPVELVRCETVNVWVPADAEIVLEGEILPSLRLPEGPFAEFTGNYGTQWENPVLKVKAITRRRDAIYQDLLTFTPEHHTLLAIPYEPILYSAVKAYVPGTVAVHVTPGGCGKFHSVISIRKQHEGDGKDAIIAGLYSVRDIKLVVVVDDDVDPFDPRDVEWAIATRVQADKDVVIISGAKGNELDPSCPKLGYTAKMGIDATKPLSRAERFERVAIPGLDSIRIEDYLA